MKSGRSKKPSEARSPLRFRGRFEVKLDPKGRLSLPPSLRLSESLVITNFQLNGRHALHVYSFTEWKKLEARIDRLSALETSVQAFARFYLSGGQVVEVDAQGRMLLPQSLRKFAQIESDAVLVGLGDKIEIWAQNEWGALFDEMAKNFDATLAAIARIEDGSSNDGSSK